MDLDPETYTNGNHHELKPLRSTKKLYKLLNYAGVTRHDHARTVLKDESVQEEVLAFFNKGKAFFIVDSIKRCHYSTIRFDVEVSSVTLLHKAAAFDMASIAATLLNRGADINSQTSKGDTSLNRSIVCDSVEVCALLLSRPDSESRLSGM